MKQLKIILITLLFIGLFTSCTNDKLVKRQVNEITYEEIILNKEYAKDSTNLYSIRISKGNQVYIYKPDDGITVYRIVYKSINDIFLIIGLSILLGISLTLGTLGILGTLGMIKN